MTAAGLYCLLAFLSKLFKELQNLVYLDVKKVSNESTLLPSPTESPEMPLGTPPSDVRKLPSPVESRPCEPRVLTRCRRGVCPAPVII
jgi:hypothetical protein